MKIAQFCPMGEIFPTLLAAPVLEGNWEVLSIPPNKWDVGKLEWLSSKGGRSFLIIAVLGRANVWPRAGRYSEEQNFGFNCERAILLFGMPTHAVSLPRYLTDGRLLNPSDEIVCHRLNIINHMPETATNIDFINRRMQDLLRSLAHIGRVSASSAFSVEHRLARLGYRIGEGEKR